MDNALQVALRDLIDRAYPEPWSTAWLRLPVSERGSYPSLAFHVICSDLPSVRSGHASWPPASRSPDSLLAWELTPGAGFWIRPKRYDPILRDRLVLLENTASTTPASPVISRDVLQRACQFAAQSGWIVWHNPPKGGARSPESAHFQSMAPRTEQGGRLFSFPCCALQVGGNSWHSADRARAHLLDRREYPALGLVLWGPVSQIADLAWQIIWVYDRALGCNLVIQPDDLICNQEVIRVFLFPRARGDTKCRVKATLLRDGELVLMKNNRDGIWGEWSFAGVEMGLLTQVEWGPVYETMADDPCRWGKTLIRLLTELTLDERDADWVEFTTIARNLMDDLPAQKPG